MIGASCANAMDIGPSRMRLKKAVLISRNWKLLLAFNGIAPFEESFDFGPRDHAGAPIYQKKLLGTFWFTETNGDIPNLTR
jgi:hypothetical protein